MWKLNRMEDFAADMLEGAENSIGEDYTALLEVALVMFPADDGAELIDLYKSWFTPLFLGQFWDGSSSDFLNEVE